MNKALHLFSAEQRYRRGASRRGRVFGLGILLVATFSTLCKLQTVAFVEVRPLLISSSSPCDRRFSRKKNRNALVYEKKGEERAISGLNAVCNKETTKGDGRDKSDPESECYQVQSNFTLQLVIEQLDSIQSPAEIKGWVSGQLRYHQDQKRHNNTSLPTWGSWSILDQVEFIKYLQRRNAFTSILPFLSIIDIYNEEKDQDIPSNKEEENGLVKVYTTALFAISSSIDKNQNGNDRLDTKAITLEILGQMQRNNVPATALTYVAVFKSLQGRPSDVVQMLRFLEKMELDLPKTKRATWNADVYHAAIYACAGKPYRSYRTNTYNDVLSPNDYDNEWQTSLSLMRHMQSKRIQPTSKTYLAVLTVLTQNQVKLPIIKSIINQWKSSGIADRCDESEKDRIWALVLNACAATGDICQTLQFVEEMSKTCKPNVLHCTALLKAFAKAEVSGRDRLAMTALDAMLGNSSAVLEVNDGNKQHRVLLPRTDLDLVVLNTILSIVVKAGKFEDAHQLFRRIQGGEYTDSSGIAISPDRITYHNLLAGCRSPEVAKQIIKEMRLSRRNRYGCIPPNSVSYAHAISACQRAITPDLMAVNELLDWAEHDQIIPTVYMYASAIWTAQRCGDLSRCLELYRELEAVGCKPNGVVFNGLICALCDNGSKKKAIEFFHLLKDNGFQISSIALKRLVSTITQSYEVSFMEEKNKKLLLEILNRLDKSEREISVSSPLFKVLISFYAANGNIDKTLEVMDQINGSLDAVCFRAVLEGYSLCPQSRWYEAVELLHTTIIKESPAPGIVDQIALSHVLMVCSRANEFEEGLSLLNLYGLPTKELPDGFPHISIVALNALIAACGRGGRPDLSLALFNDISSRYGLQPDSRSYRSAIIACNQAQHAQGFYGADDVLQNNQSNYNDRRERVVEWWECSLALYRRMTEEGLTPDVQTHSSIISSCQAAGEWQRALWVLQTIMDRSEGTPSPSILNIYCWNAALSACEKGGAWVEALDLYERMLESPFKPNVVTINSMIQALDKADQKELAQSIYDEGLELGLFDPWKETINDKGESIVALDLHTFSESMASAAIRKTMNTWLDEKDSTGILNDDFVIITGKGKHSTSQPVLQRAAKEVLLQFGIKAKIDKSNSGRLVVCKQELLDCFDDKSWS